VCHDPARVQWIQRWNSSISQTRYQDNDDLRLAFFLNLEFTILKTAKQFLEIIQSGSMIKKAGGLNGN